MDNEWLKERIEATKAIIEAMEDAILGLSVGTQQSYTLDTGQTRTTVTKKNMVVLENALDSAYNRLATLTARCEGAAGQARPAW